MTKKKRYRPHMNRGFHHVIKSSGELEAFSAQKLQRSLRRTGLPPKFCKEITKEVAEKVAPGYRTRDIYKQTLRLVKKQSPVAAVHYSLKKAIFDLGPSGFVFEKFVSRYFETLGYTTYIGTVMQGQFVRHEVDIIGSKKNYQVYVECKFHNTVGRKNDIKVALYVKARWDDLKNGPDGKYLREFFLASNTSFTQDAIDYASGCGLQLLGVNAPSDESFLDKIRKHKLFPITSLKRLKKIYCQELLDKNLILCSDLLNEKEVLLKIGMSEEEIQGVFHDIKNMLD